MALVALLRFVHPALDIGVRARPGADRPAILIVHLGKLFGADHGIAYRRSLTTSKY